MRTCQQIGWRRAGRGSGLAELRDRGQSRGYDRVGAGSAWFGRAEQGQMGLHCGEQCRGHAEHPAEFIHSLERRRGRPVIESRSTIIGKQSLLRPRHRRRANPVGDSRGEAPRAVGVIAEGAKQGFHQRRRSQVRIDPRRLVFEPHHHPAVADGQRMGSSVERPTLFGLRVRLVEDGLGNRPVSRRRGDGVVDQIVGDADLGSPARGQMEDQEGDQRQGPQHDQQREAAVAGHRPAWHPRSPHPAHRPLGLAKPEPPWRCTCCGTSPALISWLRKSSVSARASR